MFKFFKDTAIVSRISYVDDKSDGFIATGDIYKGYLKPLSPSDSLYQGAFGKDYSFTTKETANIIEADQLNIDGQDFKVKGIAGWEGISIKYKRLLLVKV